MYEKVKEFPHLSIKADLEKALEYVKKGQAKLNDDERVFPDEKQGVVDTLESAENYLNTQIQRMGHLLESNKALQDFCKSEALSGLLSDTNEFCSSCSNIRVGPNNGGITLLEVIKAFRATKEASDELFSQLGGYDTLERLVIPQVKIGGICQNCLNILQSLKDNPSANEAKIKQYQKLKLEEVKLLLEAEKEFAIMDEERESDNATMRHLKTRPTSLEKVKTMEACLERQLERERRTKEISIKLGEKAALIRKLEQELEQE